MRSKVRTIRGALDDRFAPRAGESALAHYRMLAAVRWKDVAQNVENITEHAFEEDRTELETAAKSGDSASPEMVNPTGLTRRGSPYSRSEDPKHNSTVHERTSRATHIVRRLGDFPKKAVDNLAGAERVYVGFG